MKIKALLSSTGSHSKTSSTSYWSSPRIVGLSHGNYTTPSSSELHSWLYFMGCEPYPWTSSFFLSKFWFFFLNFTSKLYFPAHHHKNASYLTKIPTILHMFLILSIKNFVKSWHITFNYIFILYFRFIVLFTLDTRSFRLELYLFYILSSFYHIGTTLS